MSAHLDHYRRRKVLVTGGAGAIGSNLCRRLAELGAETIVILDDLSSSYVWNVPRGRGIPHLCCRLSPGLPHRIGTFGQKASRRDFP